MSGQIYNWKQNGILDKPLSILKYSLNSRKQGLVLNGQHSFSFLLTLKPKQLPYPHSLNHLQMTLQLSKT